MRDGGLSANQAAPLFSGLLSPLNLTDLSSSPEAAVKLCGNAPSHAKTCPQDAKVQLYDPSAPLQVAVLLGRPFVPEWLVAAIEHAADTASFRGFVLPPLLAAKHNRLADWLLGRMLEMDGGRSGAPRNLLRRTKPPFPVCYVRDGGPAALLEDLRRSEINLLLLACEIPAEVMSVMSESLPFGACEIVTEARNAAAHACPGALTLAYERPSLTTNVVHQRGNARRILCRAETRVHSNSVSVNADRSLRPSRNLLRDGLNIVRKLGTGEASDPPPEIENAPAGRMTLARTTRLLGKIGVRVARNQLLSRSNEQWGIGLIKQSDLDLSTGRFGAIQWLDADPSSFLADPFIIEEHGTSYIFLEQLPYSTGKGHISVIVVSPDGKISPPVKVLDRQYHLSFPFVFKRNGTFYMIPESAESGSVDLYEATDFPFSWKHLRAILPRFPGIDSIIYDDGRKIWLFTSFGNNLNQDNNLHLFSAQSLSDEFRPHKGNPVRTGLSCSRMAGALFTRDGCLFRPAQNCMPRYGYSVVLNRIEELNDDLFRETPMLEICPDPASAFPLGLHTLNVGRTLTAIDGLRTLKPRRGMFR